MNIIQFQADFKACVVIEGEKERERGKSGMIKSL